MTTKTMNAKVLNNAQQKQLLRLVNTLTVAERDEQKAKALHEAAQNTLSMAQGQANDFLGYLTEELGVPEGWAFNQQRMAFEQVQTPPNGDGEGK